MPQRNQNRKSNMLVNIAVSHVISVASEPFAAKIVILCYFYKSFSHLLHQAFLQNNIEANFPFKRIVFVIKLPLVCFLKNLKLTGELRAIHAGI